MTTKTVFEGQDLHAIIAAGIVGIKPATLRQNPRNVDVRSSDIEPLGMADDQIKRVYFYHNQLADQVKDLESQIKELVRSVFGEQSPRSLGSFLVALCDGSKLDAAQRIQGLEKEVNEKITMIEIVDNMFWAEVRRRNPELQGYKNITLHSDWSFSGSDRPSAKRGLNAKLASMFDQAGFKDLGDGTFMLDLDAVMRRRAGRGNGHADGPFGHAASDRRGHEGEDLHPGRY